MKNGTRFVWKGKRPKGKNLMALILAFDMCCGMQLAYARIWYVDSAAIVAGDGSSWDNAWKNVDQISGVSAGDTVFISGGPAGGSRTYSVASPWTPIDGVTYQIGQDALHKGTAIFNAPQGWIRGPLMDVAILGDAGDGQRHFRLAPNMQNVAIVADGAKRLHVSFVDGGKQAWSIFAANRAESVELDHCYWYKLTNAKDDNLFWIVTYSDRPFDDTKIHDNVFYSPHSNTKDGWGDDFGGAVPLWSGVSFYNNRLFSYGIANYLASQHQDGVQPLAGDHLKIYNNYFENITDYAVYFDGVYGGFTNCYVYNNTIVLADPNVQHFVSPQGIAIGGEGTRGAFSNIIVANNLVVDYGGLGAGSIQGHGSPVFDCLIANNVALNSGAFFGDHPGVSLRNNLNLRLANGTGSYVRYTQNHADIADFHLLATDRICKGKGINLSTYFTIDKDGLSRVGGSAWDIGPYKYVEALEPRNIKRTVSSSPRP